MAHVIDHRLIELLLGDAVFLQYAQLVELLLIGTVLGIRDIFRSNHSYREVEVVEDVFHLA